MISIYSVSYMEHRFHEEEHETGVHVPKSAYASYYALYLLYAVGMMGTVLATNLIQFYLSYELMLVPSWALINNYGYRARARGLMALAQDDIKRFLAYCSVSQMGYIFLILQAQQNSDYPAPSSTTSPMGSASVSFSALQGYLCLKWGRGASKRWEDWPTACP